jgi:hypothetical protein
MKKRHSILHPNRRLEMITQCDRVLVRATEELGLLGAICRILVEPGGYRLAWAGFAEADEAKTVRPVAQADFEEGYLETVNITWADTERGRGPAGTARRSQGVQDEVIAHEIGHTSRGQCVRSTYGGVPANWLNGEAPNLTWLLATIPPARAALEKNG